MACRRCVSWSLDTPAGHRRSLARPGSKRGAVKSSVSLHAGLVLSSAPAAGRAINGFEYRDGAGPAAGPMWCYMVVRQRGCGRDRHAEELHR
jgi:hypothetical protein